MFGKANTNPPPAPSAINLAPYGTATQSSTGYSGVASRAIDRNTSGRYNQRSVTHTDRNAQAWWQVALAQSTNIEEVILYNRADCCANRLSDVHVFVSSTPFGNQTLSELLSQTDIYHQYLPGAQPGQVTLSVNSAGQYVRVQLAGTNFLSLAEVQVMGQVGVAQ